VRAVDLAIYADMLAGEHAALEARSEQARSRLREAAIERDAREHLPAKTVARLEGLRILGGIDEAAARADLRRLTKALDALEQLQGWIEARLASGECSVAARSSSSH